MEKTISILMKARERISNPYDWNAREAIRLATGKSEFATENKQADKAIAQLNKRAKGMNLYHDQFTHEEIIRLFDDTIESLIAWENFKKWRYENGFYRNYGFFS